MSCSVRRLAAWAGGVLFLFAILVVLLHRPLLHAAGRFLVVAEPPVPADFVFLLNGGMEHRPLYAAELLEEGFAPKVVIVQAAVDVLVDFEIRRTQTEISVAALRHLGIAEHAIEVIPYPGGADSTQDEGRALRAHLQERPARRVLVVTSDFHTRRTRWTLRRELDGTNVDLQMVPAGTEFTETDWWRNEETFLWGIEEYLKILHTWLVR